MKDAKEKCMRQKQTSFYMTDEVADKLEGILLDNAICKTKKLKTTIFNEAILLYWEKHHEKLHSK